MRKLFLMKMLAYVRNFSYFYSHKLDFHYWHYCEKDNKYSLIL